MHAVDTVDILKYIFIVLKQNTDLDLAIRLVPSIGFSENKMNISVLRLGSMTAERSRSDTSEALLGLSQPRLNLYASVLEAKAQQYWEVSASYSGRRLLCATFAEQGIQAGPTLSPLEWIL